jgi:hypothetical protein
MANEQLIPDYKKWGQADGAKFFIEIAASNVIEVALGVAQNQFDLSDMRLDLSLKVESYRGPKLPAVQLVLLRFLKKNSPKKIQIGSEHLTVLIDINNKQLYGFTKMFYDAEVADHLLPHDQALDRAVSFIRHAAPDLIPGHEIKIPEILKCDLMSKLTFSEKLVVGFVEIHWINKHYEDVVINGITQRIWGMKVKMFIPDENLWAWVIVDAAGNIQTFEKNIFWNFDAFVRDTQMWLHDDWLKINATKFLESDVL